MLLKLPLLLHFLLRQCHLTLNRSCTFHHHPETPFSFLLLLLVIFFLAMYSRFPLGSTFYAGSFNVAEILLIQSRPYPMTQPFKSIFSFPFSIGYPSRNQTQTDIAITNTITIQFCFIRYHAKIYIAMF
jgi:hypothetical protein